MSPVFLIIGIGLVAMDQRRGDESIWRRGTRSLAGEWTSHEANRFHQDVAESLSDLRPGIGAERTQQGDTVVWDLSAASDAVAPRSLNRIDESLRRVAIQNGATIWVDRHEAGRIRYELSTGSGARALVRIKLARAKTARIRPAAPVRTPSPTPSHAPPAASAAPSEFEEQPSGATPEATPEPTATEEEPIKMKVARVGDGPACAIIIDDLGERPDLLALAKQIDFPVTYAVTPYRPYSRECAEALHRAGNEILLHLPMEPLSYPRNDPGRLAVFRGMSRNDVLSLTARALGEIPEAVGVNNHMGSSATRDAAIMRNVLSVVGERGMFFIDSRTATDSVAYRVARELHVPTAARQVFLDQQSFDPGFTRKQLVELFAIARRSGSAIGIGHWNESTLQVIRDEAPALAGSDVRLVFASALVSLGT